MKVTDQAVNISSAVDEFMIKFAMAVCVVMLVSLLSLGWRVGIVVVAAGGNEGDHTKNLANPASDPHVLAVGAMDSAGTVRTGDDSVPSWSTDGTADRHVDLTAPGVSVLSLRVPGGTADTRYPGARVGSRFARA